MAIENNKVTSEAQVQAFQELLAVASDEFFNQEDAEWLRLSRASDKWATSTLRAAAKRLLAHKEMGFNPYPSCLKNATVVIVDDLPSNIIAALKESGSTLYYAMWNSQIKRLEGAQRGDIPAFDYAILNPTNEEVIDKWDAKGVIYIGETLCPYAYSVAELNLRHLVSAFAEKSAEQHAKFLALYTGFEINPEKPLEVSLKPYDADEAVYAEAVFDFKNLLVKTSRDFKLRGGFFVRGIGEVNPLTAVLLLGMQLAGFSTAGQVEIDTVINILTQGWEEEDTYGRQMDRDEQLRTIRKNSVALIKGEPNDDLPYFKLVNNNNSEGVLEACRWYNYHKIPFFTDKYGMKRVVTRAGVAALWIGMDFQEGVMKTITDIGKLSKLLNRGWNAVAISASQGIPGTKGYRPYADAALHIVYENEVIRINGDKVNALFHNGRIANNGSGVAYTRAWYAYTVHKTIRGTFNATNLRQGQTLDDAKAAIEKLLSDLLSTKKTIKPKKRGGVKLLEFNRVTLLEYKGHNQRISLNPKHGASYSVRKLATSNSLSIELNVVYFSSDMEIKSRGLGIKAVLKDGNHVVIWDDKNERLGWEVSYNMETQKGTSARLHLYAEHLLKLTGKPSYYDPTHGVIHTPVFGEDKYIVQDLDNDKAPFYEWCRENMKTYYIRDWVSKSYFEFILLGHAKLLHRKNEPGIIQEALAHPVNNDIWLINAKTGEETSNPEEAMNDEGTGYLVMEQVEGIFGTFPIQIEVSTPRENTGEQASTLEQVGATYASYPKLGEALVATSADTEEAVMEMVAMATNDPTMLL